MINKSKLLQLFYNLCAGFGINSENYAVDLRLRAYYEGCEVILFFVGIRLRLHSNKARSIQYT